MGLCVAPQCAIRGHNDQSRSNILEPGGNEVKDETAEVGTEATYTADNGPGNNFVQKWPEREGGTLARETLGGARQRATSETPPTRALRNTSL